MDSRQTPLAVDQTVAEVLCTKPYNWMMCHSEKLCVIGLISVLNAKDVLEYGFGEGGETRWLSAHVERVVTVDFNPEIIKLTASLNNVEAWCMTTDEASEKIKTSGRIFDLAIIDAGHYSEHVRKDIENAITFSKVILVHDVYNPQTRKGFLAAIENHDVWSDIEFVTGSKQADGMWGGLGIIVPSWPRSTPTYIAPRTKIYPLLRLLSLPQRIKNKLLSIIGHRA